ncbi:hypothetical protein BaRGS_00032481 [Batillaria attramentaria]|uniref:Uncharacterized protein n=1 Tax=Batillaria attramentaria TaxID=370345 RepID=A0ABD0JML2_9CAEN
MTNGSSFRKIPPTWPHTPPSEWPLSLQAADCLFANVPERDKRDNDFVTRVPVYNQMALTSTICHKSCSAGA